MRGTTRLAALLAVLFAVGCQHGNDAPEPRVEHKPQAPVDLELTAQRGAAGTYRIVASATPSVNTRSLEIVVFGPDGETRQRFSRVRAGDTRTLTTRVRVGVGARVRGSARVSIRPGFAPNRVAELSLGNPPVARVAPTRVITLPGGEIIEEVRQ